MKTTHLLFTLLPLFLAACTTPHQPPKPVEGAQPPTMQSKTESAVTQAAATPFTDLNLVRAEIPEVLKAAQRDPYGSPADQTCPGLSTAVQALDAALGADLDTPSTAANPSLIERGSNAASNAATGALRGAAEGVIPFRGWVRKLSGAEKYSREVAAAIAAGTIRRAYLKGVGKASGCLAPAAPR
jgi:hypothetical protein